MASIQQIEAWIPQAIEIFTTYFPLDFVPEVRIANEKNLIATRDNIILELDAENEHLDLYEYESVMETIKGKYGWIILINQKAVPTPSKNPRADYFFYHSFWHELGHFLAIKSEATDLHRFYNPNLPIETAADVAKKNGYQLWSEFIAESIASHVDAQSGQNSAESYSQLDAVIWEIRMWEPIAEELVALLDETFNHYYRTVDAYALGIYFARLLKNPSFQSYTKAVNECRLMVENWPLAPKQMEPGEIDATAIISQNEIYRATLHEIKAMLENKLQEEKFWLVDEDWIQKIGENVIELNTKKLALMAGGSDKAIAEMTMINSMSPAEREKYLRQQLGDEQYEFLVHYGKENSIR